MGDNNNIEIIERLVRIETLLEKTFKDHDSRITKLENNQSWLVKSILGVIIVALVSLVIVGGN